eukprot:6324382-Pyramimonas_sp.AAC.1
MALALCFNKDERQGRLSIARRVSTAKADSAGSRRHAAVQEEARGPWPQTGKGSRAPSPRQSRQPKKRI